VTPGGSPYRPATAVHPAPGAAGGSTRAGAHAASIKMETPALEGLRTDQRGASTRENTRPAPQSAPRHEWRVFSRAGAGHQPCQVHHLGGGEAIHGQRPPTRPTYRPRRGRQESEGDRRRGNPLPAPSTCRPGRGRQARQTRTPGRGRGHRLGARRRPRDCGPGTAGWWEAGPTPAPLSGRRPPEAR
jgi:hypothetical protein